VLSALNCSAKAILSPECSKDYIEYIDFGESEYIDGESDYVDGTVRHTKADSECYCNPVGQTMHPDKSRPKANLYRILKAPSKREIAKEKLEKKLKAEEIVIPKMPFKKIMSDEAPVCGDIKCLEGTLAHLQALCNDQFGCDGVTYTTGQKAHGDGCLKYRCYNKEKYDEMGMTHFKYDFYAKDAELAHARESAVKKKEAKRQAAEEKHQKEFVSKMPFRKLFTAKAPDCPEIKCSPGSLAELESLCNAEWACDGVTYTTRKTDGGQGCLKRRCHSYDDYDNAGYTKGTDDYYTKIGFSLQDERDEKDREKKEKEQHAKERVQKNNKEKSRVAGVEAQQKAQQKKDKDNALKARDQDRINANGARDRELNEKWTRPYYDGSNGFGTCTAKPCKLYADQHCRAGGKKIGEQIGCSWAGTLIQGCNYKCARELPHPEGWIGPPVVKNTTEFPKWKGFDDWKKEEQESFHAHAYAEKRHKRAKEDLQKKIASTAMLTATQMEIGTDQEAILEKLVALIPTDYVQACQVARNLVQKMGVHQFNKLTGVKRMNCKKGIPLDPSAYSQLITALRKRQQKVSEERFEKKFAATQKALLPTMTLIQTVDNSTAIKDDPNKDMNVVSLDWTIANIDQKCIRCGEPSASSFKLLPIEFTEGGTDAASDAGDNDEGAEPLLGEVCSEGSSGTCAFKVMYGTKVLETKLTFEGRGTSAKFEVEKMEVPEECQFPNCLEKNKPETTSIEVRPGN